MVDDSMSLVYISEQWHGLGVAQEQTTCPACAKCALSLPSLSHTHTMGERERERGLTAYLKTHLSLFLRDIFEAKAGMLEEEISRAHFPGFTQTKSIINHPFCEKGSLTKITADWRLCLHRSTETIRRTTKEFGKLYQIAIPYK